MRVTREESTGTMAYNILGVNLKEVRETKYLGVKLQSDLRWNSQTHYATRKAIGVLSFLGRTFHHCSPSTKERLYLTLARPHLDYATAAWDPYTNKLISSIKEFNVRLHVLLPTPMGWTLVFLLYLINLTGNR